MRRLSSVLALAGFCALSVPALAAPPAEPAPEGPAAEGPAPELAPPPPLAGAIEASTGAPSAAARVFNLPVASPEDPYGPRPADVPRLSREQIVRYALRNSQVEAAEHQIEAMRAQLLKAKFAWVPIIKTSASLSPGANIQCDDVQLQQSDGQEFSFQWCRPGDADVDIQTVQGYFSQLGQAGVFVGFSADVLFPVYTFGKILGARRLAEVGVEVAQLEKVATEQETVKRVYEAHAALLLARESVEILEEAWKVVQKERAGIERDLGSGFDVDPSEINPDRDPDDLLELEVGEVELALLMREARRIEATALASLWAFAGDAAPRGFDVSEGTLELASVPGGIPDVQELQRLALQNRPEARMADALVELRAGQEKLARSQFLPDFGVAMAMRYGYANAFETADGAAGSLPPQLYYAGGRLNRSSITLALVMSWNLDFHMDAFGLRQARAQRARAQSQRETARQLLLFEVQRAYLDLEAARDQVEFMQTARDKAWSLVLAQQAKQSVGGGEYEDIQRALRRWAEYEFKRAESVQAHNVAIARLSRAVGEDLLAREAANLAKPADP